MSITYKDIKVTDYNVYTVNNQQPDANANFTITKETLNSADVIHTHVVGDITGLQTAIDLKSGTDHTHNYVTGLVVNNVNLTSLIKLETQGNLTVSAAGQIVTLTAGVPASTSANSIVDVATQLPTKTFIGTQVEWNAFVPVAGTTYIVYIHD